MYIHKLIRDLQHRLETVNASSFAGDVCRAHLKEKGFPFVPFGTGNEKTGLPGFFRRVGATCPRDCPYLNKGCYAQSGNSNLHQQRAGDSVKATVVSFVVCAILASKYYQGAPARLFVSGDLCRNGKVDQKLVLNLKKASRVLRKSLGQEIVGYGYTHTHNPSLLQDLRKDGIVLLESDVIGPGCAIVHPHKEMETLPEASGFKYVKCLAQTSGHKVKCAFCTLCRDAYSKRLCVVFDPHGPTKKNLQLQYTSRGE